MRRLVLALVLALLLVPFGACSRGEEAVPFTLGLTPEFVQGAVTGQPTGVIVTIENESETDAPVALSAVATGATVEIAPAEIAAGEIAEVWVTVAPEITDGTPIELVVTGERDGVTASATRTFAAYGWGDDRGEYAGTLFDLFQSWLEANHPELGITADSTFTGSFVAPELLVVSHYLYLSEEWEIGLSWHVMIPPDDWAELYLRPRGEAVPTLAFRLSSQAAALGSPAVVEIIEVPAPAEVTR